MEQESCRKPSKDVEFQDVYYTVKERKHFIKVTGTREILRGVSGSFRNGQLSAIMGPSGAGKSSLLNAISGLITSGVEGHIKTERKHSCYITQEDHHQTLLSVEELMNLSCNLKLPHSQRKQQLITEILENLHLNHRRKINADKLSGGERKRLSIALELVVNPNIFFLDEPTSGLDEVTAAQCIRLLSHLAREGRTIVCTIHQPSATVFNYFDNIFVLARGLCVYQGGPRAVVPYLKMAQYDCPKHYSPSDYIIELCDSEDSNVVEQLSALTENGKLVYVPQPQDVELAEQSKSLEQFRASVTTFFVEEPRRQGFPHLFSTGAVSTDGSLIGGVTALYEHMKAFSKRWQSGSELQTSGFHQFCVLLKMMMVRLMRARIVLVIQFMHHIMTGLCFGLIFFALGNQGSRMFDHLKFCIGVILVICYTQIMVPVLSYPMEVKLVKKETFNRWYSLTPYYMALTISRIPLQIILNLVFLSITYWMAGLPPQVWRFALFTVIGLLISFTAEGMGLAIGSTFSITNGCAVGPLMIAPLMGLAIYGFDFAAQIPTVMNIFMQSSFMRVGVMALVLTVFGFNRADLDCDEIYCHFGDPHVLLKFLDIEHVSMYRLFAVMILLMVLYRVLMFLGLKRRCCT